MSAPRRVYLDNAATTWPKPESVYQAVDAYQRHIGAAARRGTYEETASADRIVASARCAIAALLGAGDPRGVVFTHNCTDALNLAIHGALARGGHAVTTVIEHNSVLRPLRFLQDAGRVDVTRVPCGPDGVVDPERIAAAMRRDTVLVVLSHASNVTGAIQPIAEVSATVRRHGALFLVDAAQTAGELPLRIDEVGADLVAAPGHKGLLGPLGTGVLIVAESACDRVAPLWQGGTGSQSELDWQPETLPDKFESGNLNVPGIAGLEAGVAFVASKTVETLRRESLELTGMILTGLAEIPRVRVFGPRSAQNRVGVVSLAAHGISPQELAVGLDAAFRVQSRPGLHCAPLMHEALGTLGEGGTLRLSVGPFNTAADVETALAGIREILGA